VNINYDIEDVKYLQEIKRLEDYKCFNIMFISVSLDNCTWIHTSIRKYSTCSEMVNDVGYLLNNY
jgi:hypothetical protein